MTAFNPSLPMWLTPGSIRSILQKGRRAFLLNPPADIKGDTNAEELKTARSIAAALEGSGLEKLVVASTYGALDGAGIGDLSVLYEFERLVKASGIPAAINRGAYYFTNLDMLLQPAKETGRLLTPFPEDMKMPMVSPRDLGEAAAARLKSPIDDVGIDHVEGPERYSFADVAKAFSSRSRPPGHDRDDPPRKNSRNIISDLASLGRPPVATRR